MPFDLGVLARKPLQASLGQLIATGGTEYFAEDGGIIYRVHEFTSSDEFVVGNLSGTVECFILAGGGAGGRGTSTNSGSGGGGGGGGLRIEQNIRVKAGVSYSVVVGAGGVPSESITVKGTNGGDSSVFNISALGGGVGGNGYAAVDSLRNGGNGGSGGGAGTTAAGPNRPAGTGFAGPPRQGNNGGGATDGSGTSAGGGGGFSNNGARGTGESTGGNGGNGIVSTFNGSSIAYAGGGGGGRSTTNSIGGLAISNRGAGGRGGNTGIGVQGSSGIVYIRYPFGFSATGGTVTDLVEDGEYYRVHTLTESDSVTFSGTGTIELLMVAGGGGGGQGFINQVGGGGGAGGLIYKAALPVRANLTYSIVVGAAGNHRSNGGDTIAFGLTALGGGHGADSDASGSPNIAASSGGSGGGGARGSVDLAYLRVGGSGLQSISASGGFGFDGGTLPGGIDQAGGGGAGGPGSGANGIGGPGLEFDIDGTQRMYATGGAGGRTGDGNVVSYVPSLYGAGGIPAVIGSGLGQGTQGVVIFKYLYFPEGQAEYTTPGTYSWTAPLGVTSVCAVCVGGGSSGMLASSTANGGGGGGLGWKNNISVIPGLNYTVVVGAAGAASLVLNQSNPGGDSYFINETTVFGGGGGQGGDSKIRGSFIGQGGGLGGAGGTGLDGAGGGGGAGGYSGNGGTGGQGAAGGGTAQPGTAGAGGGGGGGGGANDNFSIEKGGGGGGVGIYGQGANGAAGNAGAENGGAGRGGSEGTNAGTPNSWHAGSFGGGGGARHRGDSSFSSGSGGRGAVRIIWGLGRRFPDNAADI